MKTLPFWTEIIKDKAIIIATVADSVFKVVGTVKPLSNSVAKNSTANGLLLGSRAIHHPLQALFDGLGKLHPVSVVFLLAECLDVLTTMIGLLVIPRIWEANPIVGGLGSWAKTLVLKVIIVFVVVAIIEFMRRPLKVGSVTLISGKLPKAIWIIPFVAGLPVFWNNLVIILELIS